ncbi:MAG: hypothetical protein ACRBCT_08655 [Alphaproteobacteria bacterium]
MANQYLALSLFIMLLSFFIILNGTADFEDTKSRPVLNSIALAFSDREVKEETFKPNTVESAEKSVREGSTLDKIQGVFQSHITGYEVTKNRLGTEMHIRMPIPRFERAVLTPLASETLQTDEGFLPTLVSLIQTRESKNPYRMDMVMNMDAEPAKMALESPQSLKNSIKIAAAFTDALERAGMERKLISTGLEKGEVGFIDLYFRRYEPFTLPQERAQAEVVQ